MTTLQTALTEAITKLSGFKPTRIVGEPNNEDCRARADDLNDLVTNILLPLLSAFASENSGDFGIKINLTNGLDDDLADALGAFGRREEEMVDDEHEHATRSYAKAVAWGVD